MRELIVDEGLEDRVLDDLKQIWESKVKQSKALEDLGRNNTPFVLQLPAKYNRFDEDRRPRAGVTLQTASGQLYKVNVPVVVTQGPAGSNSFSQAPQRLLEWRDTRVPRAAIGPPVVNIIPSKEKPPQMIVAVGKEPGEDAGDFLNLQTLETLAQAPAGTVSKDIDDILKEVIEDEINKAETEPEYADYPGLLDIVQLDGPIDNSDVDAEDEVPVEDNDFLGMINAEAMKAMQEVDGSSDGSASSSSDSDGVDELADVVEEDPLNSGDDVIEQDIPDLFDTDNVIVCQYDKIHRSKNRWKFHLKDGVMCYSGRDYVFSKAVGEAEW
ncbi:hypothetical protein NHX12_022648 [Muraenolepis orangiensis]|uniref:Uncharacterized protein n=1 Tax=Muraenolepis orangiensis TaxID=630683 RepID=A0A9Q0IV90_9TELE|nr:hypothetical protein NHX12_022648 [Muraenolepis orangiensis]